MRKVQFARLAAAVGLAALLLALTPLTSVYATGARVGASPWAGGQSIQSGDQLSWWYTVDVLPSGFFAVRSFAYSDPWCGELRGDTDPELAAALCGWIWDSHVGAGLYFVAAFGPGAAAGAFLIGLGYVA